MGAFIRTKYTHIHVKLIYNIYLVLLDTKISKQYILTLENMWNGKYYRAVLKNYFQSKQAGPHVRGAESLP